MFMENLHQSNFSSDGQFVPSANVPSEPAELQKPLLPSHAMYVWLVSEWQLYILIHHYLESIKGISEEQYEYKAREH